MQIGIIENAWWQSPIDPIRGIELTKRIGFDTYDLYPINGLTPQARREMHRALTKADLRCFATITPVFSMTDISPDVRRFTAAWARTQLDIAYDFECSVLVLPLGEYALEGQEIEPKVQWGWAVEGVREIADYAEDLDIKIGLEFLAHKLALLNSVDKMVKFIDDVDRPAVNANIDVSHLYLNGDSPKSIEKLRGKVVGVHFSDCKGKVHGDLPPGRGSVPLREYLKALNRVGYENSVSVELEWCRTPGKIREWVGEEYAATDEMMRSLGLRDA